MTTASQRERERGRERERERKKVARKEFCLKKKKKKISRKVHKCKMCLFVLTIHENR